MSVFQLYCDSASLAPGFCPPGQAALWQGRDMPQGMISLEKMLEDRLPYLREQHMRWAYATGCRNGLAKKLECGATPSMWWTSLVYERHPRLSPELYPVYKLACVELWLCEGKATGLEVHGASPDLQKSLASLCGEYGLPCSFVGSAQAKRGKAGLLRRLYAAAPAPVRALARFCHWWWTARRRLPPLKSLPPYANESRESALIVTYFPNLDQKAARDGRFRSRYWENLHSALSEQAKAEGMPFVRWLFIYFPAPGMELRECIGLRDRFAKAGGDGVSFHFWEEFLQAADLWRGLRRWGRLCVASLLAQREFAASCQIEKSRFNFWSWIAWDWAESMRGWRCLERCLLNLAFENYCQLAGAQRWTLFPLENCPWERLLTEAARRVRGNGPVFGAQHSVIRLTDFRYFDDPATFVEPQCAAFQPDLVAGNGKAALAQWRANGLPEKRLYEVEALRYLYLAGRAGRKTKTSRPERLLLATSFFAAETDCMLKLVAEGLAAGLLDDYELVLKPHPYLLPEAWLSQLPPEQAGKIKVSTASLEEELTQDTAVWAANSTTVALEAALLGLPLMVMAASNDFDLCPIQGAKGLLRTATLADVKYCLARLAPPQLEPGYLNLNPALTAWRQLLGLGKNGYGYAE